MTEVRMSMLKKRDLKKEKKKRITKEEEERKG